MDTLREPIDRKRFKIGAKKAIDDLRLQSALEGATGIFRAHRRAALDSFPGVEELRDHLRSIRASTIANLGEHLETFEQNAKANGTHVHWARDAAEASAIIIEIARQNQVVLAAKSKSMATEEIRLNTALEKAGITPVETDLGEWIIQLADEPPSHIIGPALHKTKEQVAELFSKETGKTLSADDIPQLTEEARRILREKFLTAGMGISGVNLGVAETGSIVLVTNEGNGRMVTSVPRIHVALMGIEKLARNWDDAAVWISLLARSATGQPLSIYTSIITGPRKTADADGPEEVHVVLLDNGRSEIAGTKYEEILQCIRCGACLNVCPVYREAGGHAYGSPYSGPIGAVISPLLFGRENYSGLPQASSLCGACLDVCPVRIDLPRMLIEHRNDEKHAVGEKIAIKLAVAGFKNPKMLKAGSGLLRLMQKPFQNEKSIRLPGTFHPSQDRALPALAPKSFHELWEEGL